MLVISLLRNYDYHISRTGSRPASGAGGRAGDMSGVPRLPPLTKTHSVGVTNKLNFVLKVTVLSFTLWQVSLPSVAAMDWVDPRDVKLGELERVINQYQVIIRGMMMITMMMMMVRTSWRM